MIDTKIVFIFLVCVLILVIAQTLHKIYLSKKTIRENFFNLGDNLVRGASSALDDLTDEVGDFTDRVDDVLQGLSPGSNSQNENENTDSTLGPTDTSTLGPTDTSTLGPTDTSTLGPTTNKPMDSHDDQQEEIRLLNKKLKILENKYRYNYSKTEQIDNELNRAQKILKQNRNKFENNITKFGEFHNNYQHELQKVLEKKLNFSDQIYESRKEFNEDKLQNIEKKIKNLHGNSLINSPETKYKSILCKANSYRLNISWVSLDGEENYNGNFIIHLNDKCISYIHNQTPPLKTFECALDDEADHLQFKFVKITNFANYNTNINLETSTVEKEMVTRNENINFPFYLIVPINVAGKCLYISDDTKVYIDTIKNNPNNRFELSHIEEKCFRNSD